MATRTEIKYQIYPALNLEDWEKTKDTLQLYIQIVGKIKLALMPAKNHWWNITLYLTPRGLTTSSIPYKNKSFEIQFDFIYHQIVINSSDGQHRSFLIDEGFSVAEFYNSLLGNLCELGIQVQLDIPKPYKVKSQEPFATDFYNKSYDKEYVYRFWKILIQIDQVFKEFSGRCYAKTSPVQLFWHSFDLVVTRFNEKKAPEMPNVNKVDKEAYSHEVISFGFWPGDDEFREAAFYSYTYPAPYGLEKEILKPNSAFWSERNGSPLAILRYEDMRNSANPNQAILDFMESAYSAGTKCAKWDRKSIDMPKDI